MVFEGSMFGALQHVTDAMFTAEVRRCKRYGAVPFRHTEFSLQLQFFVVPRTRQLRDITPFRDAQDFAIIVAGILAV